MYDSLFSSSGVKSRQFASRKLLIGVVHAGEQRKPTMLQIQNEHEGEGGGRGGRDTITDVTAKPVKERSFC